MNSVNDSLKRLGTDYIDVLLLHRPDTLMEPEEVAEAFSSLEFAPRYDEETGFVRAGVRFWQLDAQKPLRLTLYEEGGYTEIIQRKGEDLKILQEKRPYIEIVKTSEATGEISVEGQNDPAFPIVPL